MSVCIALLIHRLDEDQRVEVQLGFVSHIGKSHFLLQSWQGNTNAAYAKRVNIAPFIDWGKSKRPMMIRTGKVFGKLV
ncbi:hypothetical protein SAY86_016557 [Trapa natans]|uniref:Uncharacterized protein n=1 Tax=Trapa natans TaxID=22666 RepID=A0AAN7LJZ4_TRANT|nr:hypothetical protein SAY86_016557 [Trapa natans]